MHASVHVCVNNIAVMSVCARSVCVCGGGGGGGDLFSSGSCMPQNSRKDLLVLTSHIDCLLSAFSNGFVTFEKMESADQAITDVRECVFECVCTVAVLRVLCSENCCLASGLKCR